MGWSFKSGKFRICVWNARLSCELSRYMFFQSLALSNDTHKTLFYSDIFVTFRYMRRCWCFEPWVSVKMKGYKTLPATMYFPLFRSFFIFFSPPFIKIKWQTVTSWYIRDYKDCIDRWESVFCSVEIKRNSFNSWNLFGARALVGVQFKANLISNKLKVL